MSKRKPTLDEAMTALKQFVNDVVSNLDVAEDRSEYGALGFTYSSRDEGGFALNRVERHRYDQLITMFTIALHNRLERATITSRLNELLLRVFDPRKKSSETTDVRKAKAIAVFRDQMKAPVKQWVTLLNVSGIEPPSQPIQTRHVEICSWDGDRLRELFHVFDRITDSMNESEATKSSLKESRADDFKKYFSGHAVGVVRSTASDAKSAVAQAVSTLSQTLDAINFLLDAAGKSDVTLRHDRTDTQRDFTLAVDVTEEAYAHHSHALRRGTRSIDERQFRELIAEGACAAVWSLIADPVLNTYQQRLLVAVQWMGSAATDKSPAQSFLKKMIAFESLLIGKTSSNDLTFRVGLYAAHVLGALTQPRAKTTEDVSHLYTIRSKIVHDGVVDVLPADDALLREYCLQVTLAMLIDSPFASMKERCEFDAWLLARARGESIT